MKIIVLTPIKNEDWILENFILTTSLFADHIIIADQFSTDKSLEIINNYPKVILINNENKNFDENYRQNLLINKSRELFPGNNLLLALDADELISANSINSTEWLYIKNLKPGTQIYFDKPDVLPNFNRMLLSNNKALLGFIDDGRKHTGIKIHGNRVPESTEKYYSNSITFLHLAFVREYEYYAKQNLYCIIERINGFNNLFIRYKRYSSYFIKKRIINLKIYNLPNNYISYNNINIYLITSDINNLYNLEILNYFKIYGENYFWLEDIWEIDYNKISCSNNKILQPPFIINILRKYFIKIYFLITQLKKYIRFYYK
jgi:hypothetical protein